MLGVISRARKEALFCFSVGRIGDELKKMVKGEK